VSAVVIVPFQPTDDSRVRAWDRVSSRLQDAGWPVVMAECPGAWCKAEAVSAALDFASGDDDDVLIVHDADVILDLASLRDTVAHVEDGTVEWAIPHTLVMRMTAESTAAYYEGMLVGKPDLVRWPYIGMAGGGCVVLRRRTYDDCPLDRRFVGWGDEDQSWGWALGTLHGLPWRAPADLFHLWHAPQPGAQGARSASLASNRLRRAYRAYRSNPEAMRALVAAGR
jgi:hypothetical protein